MKIPRWIVTCTDGKERTESEAQALAFRLWQESGCSGSNAVFEDIGKHKDVKTSERTIWRWKEQYRWAERNAALNARAELDWCSPTEEAIVDSLAIAASGGKGLVNASEAIQTMHLAIIDKAIVQFGTLLDEGLIKMTSVKDLKTLMETRQLIKSGGKSSGKSGAPQVIVQVITGIPRPRDENVEIVDAEVVEAEIIEEPTPEEKSNE